MAGSSQACWCCYEKAVPFLCAALVNMISSSSALMHSAVVSATVSLCTTCGDSLNSSSSSMPAENKENYVLNHTSSITTKVKHWLFHILWCWMVGKRKKGKHEDCKRIISRHLFSKPQSCSQSIEQEVRWIRFHKLFISLHTLTWYSIWKA